MKKRILAMFLAVVMIFSMLPAQAFAQEADEVYTASPVEEIADQAPAQENAGQTPENTRVTKSQDEVVFGVADLVGMPEDEFSDSAAQTVNETGSETGNETETLALELKEAPAAGAESVTVICKNLPDGASFLLAKDGADAVALTEEDYSVEGNEYTFAVEVGEYTFTVVGTEGVLASLDFAVEAAADKEESSGEVSMPEEATTAVKAVKSYSKSAAKRLTASPKTDAEEGEKTESLSMLANGNPAVTLYVDAGWSEGNVPEGKTWGANAFNTIQGAVDKVNAAQGVNTIRVAAGTYNGNVELNKSNLKFTADSKEWYGNVAFIADEGATVTLTGYFTFGNDSVENIANLTVSGFTCTNDNYPVYLMNSGGTSSNVVVENNTLTDGQIYINSGVVKDVCVSGNIVTENDVTYCLSLGGTSSIIKNTTVSGNTFNGKYVGVFGQFVDEGIQITNNTFNLTDYLWINNGKAANTGKMTLSGNEFNTNNPIFAFSTKYTVKSDIVIGEDNTAKENAFSDWAEIAPDSRK